jgi:hypothetical protein
MDYKIFSVEMLGESGRLHASPPRKAEPARQTSSRTNSRHQADLNETPYSKKSSSRRGGPTAYDHIDDLRSKLNSRGSAGLITVGRCFINIDQSNNRMLNFNEFRKSILDSKLDMTQSELKEIFDFFDVDKDGWINYDQFLLAVRGPMSDARRTVVNQAFSALDRDNHDIVPIDSIKNHFNPARHPSVLSRARTTDQVLMEFLDTLEGYYQIKGFRDGNVTRDEFIEFYSFISAVMSSDSIFADMVADTWGIAGRTQGQGEFGKKRAAQNAEAGLNGNGADYQLRDDG